MVTRGNQDTALHSIASLLFTLLFMTLPCLQISSITIILVTNMMQVEVDMPSKVVPAFLSKLWTMVDHPDTGENKVV